MGRRRRLRKNSGVELEVNKQVVVASDEANPPNVVVSDEAMEEMRELLSHMFLHYMQQLWTTQF
jgi:hypothetical protein